MIVKYTSEKQMYKIDISYIQMTKYAIMWLAILSLRSMTLISQPNPWRLLIYQQINQID